MLTASELKKHANDILKSNLSSEYFDRVYGIQCKKSQDEKDAIQKKKQQNEDDKINRQISICNQLIAYLAVTDTTICCEPEIVGRNDFLFSIANWLNKNTSITQKQEAAAISTIKDLMVRESAF